MYMKHFFFLLLMALTATGSSLGAPISPQQAMTRLRGDVRAARYSSAPLTLIYSDARASEPAYYVFSSANTDGFVIAGGDDLAAPVLGYSDTGKFSYDALPVQMKEWLDGYALEIEWARSQPAPAPGKRRSLQRPERSAIPLMVNAHWDQDAPYNLLCPVFDGERCATGCVATAIAQIMHFWKYPAVGKGTNSYDWIPQKDTIPLSMDFSKVKFEWKSMPDIHFNSWTAKQDSAVAVLMQACGYAMDMDYNIADNGGSGAQTAIAAERLVTYFDYAPSSTHYSRDSYDLYVWEDMVYSSLANGCPVLYHGSGSHGGHAFVVDGYQGDGYFHLNWGWSGMSNGYFLLTALDPANLGIGGGAGGFNYSQGAVLNLRPNFSGSTPEYSISATDFTITLKSSNQLTLSGGFYNQCGKTIPKIYLGAMLENESGTLRYVNYAYTTSLQQYYGFNSYTLTLPSGLADGTYKVNPAYAFSYSGTGAKKMPAPSRSADHYILTVSNGKYSLAKLSDAEISASGLKIGPKLYLNAKCHLEATLTNSNSTEVYKDVYLGWYSSASDASFMGVGASMITAIPAGSSITWDKAITVPSRVNKTPFSSTLFTAPANFKVALVVQDPLSTTREPIYNRISEFVDAPLVGGSPSGTLESSGLTVVNADKVYAMDIALNFNLKCTSGYFANNIYVFVLDSAGNQMQYHLTPDHFINEGENKNVTFNFPFPAGEAKKHYQVLLNYRPTPSSSLRYLDQAYFTVGTTGVETVTGSGRPSLIVSGGSAYLHAASAITSVELYDMQGMRRDTDVAIEDTDATVSLESLARGIYLLRVSTRSGAYTLRLLRP